MSEHEIFQRNVRRWFDRITEKIDRKLWHSPFYGAWYIVRPRTGEQQSYDISWIKAVICRIRKHPCGSIYYNSNGYEPDGRCRNCFEDIG